MPNDRVTNYSKLFILHGNLVEIVFVWKRIVLALSPIKEASEGNQYWNLVAGIRGLLGYEWECSLEHSWREGNYRADHLAKLAKREQLLHLLPTLVQPAQSLARPPISKFSVRAVGLGSNSRVFIGVDLEFPGLPLHQSVHAEQFLCNNLAVNGCPRLIALVVSAAPCGHCRQFFQELRDSSSLQILITSDHPNQNFSKSPLSFKPLPEFLTNPFGPCDLLDKESPLLLEPHSTGLSFDTSRKQANFEALLRIEALEAANKSHAPYSRCLFGVALMDPEGKVYRGSYIESAAYNLSLGLVHCNCCVISSLELAPTPCAYGYGGLAGDNYGGLAENSGCNGISTGRFG
ncbi:cytidine deaminase 1-like [Coffea arabica]|uniref:Cytidine deaminase 1-like n=1 Tax=Coffea arabica TaxID=13443 RepID=A0ABM4W1R9_COFAR